METSRRAALCVCMLFSMVGTMHGQSEMSGTASFTGKVVDQTGTAIPKATVAVTNEASGALRSALTEADGKFLVNGLAAGTYSVAVVAPGFATDARTNLKLTSGTQISLPITMAVSSMSQSVTVEASVTLAVEAAPSQSSLEAKSAESIISSTYIRNFIASTGDYSDVLQMSPGTFSMSPNGPGWAIRRLSFADSKMGSTI